MSFFVLNTNTAALYAQRSLFKNTMELQKSVERMSTGKRLNSAGDDAAGLSIADKMKAEIEGLRKAKQNSLDGISMTQSMDGGLQAIQENLFRIRELMVQGLNGTNGASELDAIQREINERVTTIGSIASTVKFNGQALLVAGTTKSLQTGAYTGETTSIAITPSVANSGIDIDIAYERVADATQYGQLTENATAGFALDEIHLSGATVASKDGDVTSGANGTLADMDAVITNINRMRSHLGAVQNSLESKISFLDLHAENITASESRIRDLDIASESSRLVKLQILQKASTTMLAQANGMTQVALDLLP
jgi:flagellin